MATWEEYTDASVPGLTQDMVSAYVRIGYPYASLASPSLLPQDTVHRVVNIGIRCTPLAMSSSSYKPTDRYRGWSHVDNEYKVWSAVEPVPPGILYNSIVRVGVV